MPEKQRYTLPTKAGDQRQLGELTGAACATLVAEIAERHAGPVVLIAPDMQNALRLHDEIRQFTDQMVMNLADWETLPYDSFSPHQEIISSRLSTLYQLPSMQRGVLIVPVNTLMQRVCPHSYLHGHALVMKKGQRLSRDALRAQLDSAGYRHVDQVMEHGEYATRGALLDLFPMGSEQPYRLDFFDDEIDSLRLFDADTQRTLEEVEAINLLPAHEFPTDKAAIELFRSQWRDTFEVKRDAEHIYQQVSKGTLPAGIEYWQPLFFSEPLPPLFSYFPANTLVVNTGSLETSAERFQADTLARFENRGVDPMRPLLPPEALWLRVDELFSELKRWPRLQLKTDHLPEKAANTNLGFQKLPDLAIQAQQKAPLDALRKFLESFSGPVIFSVESEGRREALGELLARIKIAPKRILRLDEAQDAGRYLMIGAAEHGFIDTQRNLALICESDLLGERVARRRLDSRRTINPDTLIRNLAELHVGQPVVHLEHGVGRYAGMTTLEAGGIKGEYLMLTYANDAKLYVPVSSLHLISRYAGGAEESAPLHKLGGDAWSRARQKAAEKVRDVAAELLDIYAQRAAKEGFAFKHDREQYQLFCDSFPFETTPDQAQAINAVLSDMCQPLAMDRLVCGDVGFGKTEVAMRAAFLAVENHKQVAVLVPTTLLAQQHYDNFRDRFANWPVRIEMLSRFRSAKEQTQILAEAAEGKIDILIGTHKLLQSDVKLRDLGLLIVDEEHRFGVRHKERIKAMRADVDILTLTATPIPRTLNMAMSGMRDLSIIATPPARRLAVKTFVREYDSLVGENKFHVVEDDGGSLEAIAKKYNVGFLALLQANPGIDPYVPRAGSVLTIPLQTLLPDAPREGIVINLAELRLYYYQPGKNTVTVYPIGIGQLGGDTLTPTMVTTISDKRANPTWTPTANIRARYKAQGIDLPAVVPAGPDNPMGHHAIRLAAYGGVYLLHGTNADFGIGMRVSSGCIRLRDGDIETLFRQVTPGTKVNIINTPIKASVEPGGVRLVEVHQPLSKNIGDDPQVLPIVLNGPMQAFKDAPQTDAAVMEHVMEVRSGMPVDVTRQAEAKPQSL
ncbi:transcription-repair coupling factor [Salmonella enterica subsp. enterica serovar Typhimurium]|nr:transcription-repair coupling factor [Salmonella enterica subsp. enterica serovar Typhimurium]ECJ7316211.1 transcription-repair coupling factor [Salmonella enterica subsp. enterica serovar Typhimurium]